jgi:hypothetical protein
MIFMLLLLICVSHKYCNRTHLISIFTREFSKSNSYESLRHTYSRFLQNSHPNTHMKTYLQPVVELLFGSLMFNIFSSQVHDPIHCLLTIIHPFPYCIMSMYALVILKSTYLLKEHLSVDSSSYTQILETSSFTGLR